jgi:ankyrin repeat protein
MSEMEEYHEIWCESDDPVILNLMLENGVDPNKVFYAGRTKLMEAAYNDNVKLVEYLIGVKGIDINKTTEKTKISGGGGHNALHYTRNLSIAKMLITAGANINAIAGDGNSPIMTCSKPNDVIKYLVSKGADRSIVNNYGKTIYDKVTDSSVLKTRAEIVNDLIVVINENNNDNEFITEISDLIISKSTPEEKSKLIGCLCKILAKVSQV